MKQTDINPDAAQTEARLSGTTPLFAAPEARMEVDDSGCIIIRHALELAPYDHQVGDWVRQWAVQAPDRIALAELDADNQLHCLTYAALRTQCDQVAQAIISRKLSLDRPIVILSEKSIPHAVLTLAALQCGVPVCPISPAYSLRPEAHGRLLACIKATTPGLVLVDDGFAFAEALALLPADVEIIFEHRPPASRPDAKPFSTLLETTPGSEVEAAFAAVDADAPAKVLFTSGSTGDPKAVIITQRMMCSNARAQSQLFPFLGTRPPVVVDWQPWHHCGGSNHNYHACLSNGGSYYIDRGKPTSEAAMAPTLRALRQISPTVHFNVPQGFDRLAFHLERDAQLKRSFFAQLDCMVYSGAAMPASLWERLKRLGADERGSPVPMVSAYGMTEMAPLHTSAHWHDSAPDVIGLPIPGSIVKLVPVDNKLELRAKGPNVTPGYFGSPQITRDAFDEDGWYRSGDIVSVIDPDAPARGLRLEGRLTDQFKLQTGTWVRVDELRTAVVDATSPLLEDVLIVGEGHAEIGILAIPDLMACRKLFNNPALTLTQLTRMDEVRTQVKDRLAAFNAKNSVSSRRIARVLLIDDVPSLAAGETTDKGHINQRRAVQRRAQLVTRLFDDGQAEVIHP